MAVAHFIEFDTREELAQQLAEDCVARLEPDLETGTFGSIAFSGGSTPKLFMQKFGAHPDLQKDMVYCALVDERFVPPDHERSNERLLRENAGFQHHPASEFLSLYRENMTPDEAAVAAGEKLALDEERPFDVMILGMGEDGHTASFFPGSPQLSAATDPAQPAAFLHVEDGTVPDPRLTMTMPLIAETEFLVLHIEGDKKRAIFEVAMRDDPADAMPIRHVIRHPKIRLDVYWAP